MKKYTNKILIIATAVLIIATTILFFIKVAEIKKEIKKQKNTELITNH
jgi:glycopeptide antibiotics resistance protein